MRRVLCPPPQSPNPDPDPFLLFPRRRISQNLETLDPSALTPLTPEVISRQATINIGTIGHVAHGKSTVVKAISGVQVPFFSWVTERVDSTAVSFCTVFLGHRGGYRQMPFLQRWHIRWDGQGRERGRNCPCGFSM